MNTDEIQALGRSPDDDNWKIVVDETGGPKISLNQMAMGTGEPAALSVHLSNPLTGKGGTSIWCWRPTRPRLFAGMFRVWMIFIDEIKRTGIYIPVYKFLVFFQVSDQIFNILRLF